MEEAIYKTPELDVVELDSMDVVCTSSTSGTSSDKADNDSGFSQGLGLE